MKLGSWDPLETELSVDLVSSTRKLGIKNILKSYTGWFDPFCELIQNALDAVDKRKNLESQFEPKIWIKINIKDKTISVTDNGIGFSQDEFRTFLAPNITFKGQGSRGNKGVGATYLAYGFNFLQFGTKTTDFSYSGIIKGGREWIEDETIKNRPKIQVYKPIHEAFMDIDRGSTFSLKLEGRFIHPRDLKWFGAKTAEQWAVILRTKTPLGGLYFTQQNSPIRCFLVVVDDVGSVSECEISECTYLYPHEVISSSKNLADVRRTQEELMKKGKDPGKLPDIFHNLNGIYMFWNHTDIINPTGEFKNDFEDGEKVLAQKYLLSFYGYFGYSTDIWDKYNDEVVGLREGWRVLRGGLQIGANCMPQGELLAIPLTKNLWYQNVMHVVVHFDNAEPDLGRKGFQPELQMLAQRISSAVVKKLQIRRGLLKKDTGAPPNISEARDVHDWIKIQEEHEKNRPLIIKREDLFLPMKEPAMTSEPLNEQDVISLFNQLLAGGVIRGIKLMGTSQHNQYDGVFRFVLKKPLENHIFDTEKNPLGIPKDVIAAEYESEPRIIEYKFSFDGLFEEIAKGEKNERQIGLVVSWQIGTKWSQRYEITPLLHFDHIQHRYFHGGTHIIKDASTGDVVFPAVILSELISYINDPQGVQEYQGKTYGEVI